MAGTDFGVSATDLSAPTGAGANPVAPVQTQLPASPIPDAIKDVGSIFVDGLEGVMKQQAVDQKNAVLKSIADPIASLNTAYASGQIGDAEYNARSRAQYNQAIAAHPELSTEISGINSAFTATTTAKTVQDNQKMADDLRQDQLKTATDQGYLISPNMTPQQQNVVIAASQSGKLAQTQLASQQAQLTYHTDVQNSTNATADRQAKTNSIQLVTNLAGADASSLSAEYTGLQARVDSGELKPQDAQLQWQARISKSQAVLTAAAAQNPDLASAYKGVYDGWLQFGNKNLDPATRSDNAQAQVKEQIAKTELIGLQDPQTKALAASSALFPRDPVLGLQTAGQSSAMLLRMGGTTPNGSTPAMGVPQVIGSPNEADVFNGLRGALGHLNQGQITNNVAHAQTEAGNAVNNTLAQVGDTINKGADPTYLKNAATFFASPEYGAYVKNGSVDPQAAQAAKKAFQTIYNPAVTQAVGDKLQGTLVEGGTTKIADAITVNFNGGGVQFAIKPNASLTPEETQAAQSVIKGLAPAVAGLNTVNRIGSHLEGNTDYQANWDANKSYYLPQLYPVKPGQIVKGYKYSGNGDYKDPNQWTQVNGPTGPSSQ